jgi:hypothetical protein
MRRIDDHQQRHPAQLANWQDGGAAQKRVRRGGGGARARGRPGRSPFIGAGREEDRGAHAKEAAARARGRPGRSPFIRAGREEEPCCARQEGGGGAPWLSVGGSQELGPDGPRAGLRLDRWWAKGRWFGPSGSAQKNRIGFFISLNYFLLRKQFQYRLEIV